MKISVLTYNVYFNKAVPNIDALLSQEQPDVVCLQEMETTEENFQKITKGGYQLADFSNSFIRHGKVYGLGTFYKEDELELISTESFDLPRSVYEVLMVILRGGNYPRTAIKTEFLHKKSNKKFTVFNLHLSPWALNGARLKQIKETLSDFHLNHENRTIIVGDFNYSYKRKSFEELIQSYGLQEATNQILFTLEQQIFWGLAVKLKLDYVLYKNCTPVKTEKIQYFESDHFPIYSEFEL